jgi:hypothetical protein
VIEPIKSHPNCEECQCYPEGRNDCPDHMKCRSRMDFDYWWCVVHLRNGTVLENALTERNREWAKLGWDAAMQVLRKSLARIRHLESKEAMYKKLYEELDPDD